MADDERAPVPPQRSASQKVTNHESASAGGNKPLPIAPGKQDDKKKKTATFKVFAGGI